MEKTILWIHLLTSADYSVDTLADIGIYPNVLCDNFFLKIMTHCNAYKNAKKNNEKKYQLARKSLPRLDVKKSWTKD